VEGGGPGTVIDGTGLLAVATDETAQTLTVTAEAAGFFSGTAAVTVIDGQVSVTSGQGESPIVERGRTEPFTANSATGGSWMWSVAGSDGASAVADNGLLTVGEGETAMMLSVTAALVGNPQIRGTAVVRIPTVTAVTVLPGGGELAPGEGGLFLALVDGLCLDDPGGFGGIGGINDPEGIEDKKGVTWSMEGNDSPGTYIEEDGRFHVGLDEPAHETAAKLTVKAVSKYDRAKFGTATVKVINPRVWLMGVTANGSPGRETTDTLRLTFDRDLADPTMVTITLNGCGAQKAGNLTKVATETGTYTLPLSGINEEGNVYVTVSADSGYGESVTVPVYYVEPVTLISVTADGTAGSVTTTQLTLTFDQSIAGLTENDITLTPGGANGGLAKGILSGAGPAYTLPVSGISAAGDVTVSVDKSGYRIAGSSQTVPVHAALPLPVTLISVTANGTAGIATTTQLTLTFDQSIAGLDLKSTRLNSSHWKHSRVPCCA
jgi:hypothetical protein